MSNKTPENPASLAATVLRENQKLIVMGRLTPSIVHEINNPLESVSNLLFLIGAEKDLSEKAQAYVSLAQKELNRVIAISRQTLNFYRDTPEPVPVYLYNLIEEVLVLYARKIETKQLQVHRQYESQRAVTVFPGEMRQVFSNLIVNAIEACPRNGSLWLRLRSAQRRSDGAPGVRVTIADNGSGMDKETRQKLGQPFLTTKGHEGTGLGLWVTMSILQQHGARLRNRSSVDARRHGTVFSVFLPTNMQPQKVPLDSSPETEHHLREAS